MVTTGVEPIVVETLPAYGKRLALGMLIEAGVLEACQWLLVLGYKVDLMGTTGSQRCASK